MQIWLRNMCLVGSVEGNVRNHSVNGRALESNHGEAHKFSHDAQADHIVGWGIWA